MTVSKSRFTPSGLHSNLASTSTTPAPPSLSEQLSIYSAARPFKSTVFAARMQRMSNNLSRRNKSLKQILQLEREIALRATGSKIRDRKKKPGESLIPTSTPSKTKLTGAALKAFARREERERKEREEEEKRKQEAGPVSVAVAVTETKMEVETGTEKDVTMTNITESLVEDEKKQQETQQEQPQQTPHEEEEKQEPSKEEENTLKRDIPTYFSIEAPPSLRPRKKYCDVTGLIAPYTDPKSGLRYHSVEVYEIIKQFGPGVDNAYLSLRGDASEVK